MARPRSDIRLRLLEAARRRFLEDGVDGASVRSIAEDAGTNLGMVVYYFPTKDDLFFAVVEGACGRLLDDLERAAGAGHDAREGLRQIFRRLGETTDEERLVVRLVVREALGAAVRRQALAARLLREHIPTVLALFTTGVRDGTFDSERHPPLLMLAALVLAGPAQLLATHLPVPASTPDLPAGPALADELLDMLLHGIGGPAGGDEGSRGRRRTHDRRVNR